MSEDRERLSVEMAREHVNGGHPGRNYASYCYRCQYFEEVRTAASERLSAIEKRRWWVYPKDQWTGRLGLGSDEYHRRTLYIGRLVVALWRCRCEDCRADLANLRDLADRDIGQEDRDKQPAGA